MSGSIPASMGNLTNLLVVRFGSDNQFTGCVPEGLQYLLTAPLWNGVSPHDFGVDANDDCDYDDSGETSGLNLPFESSSCCEDGPLCTREPLPPEMVRIIGDTNTSLTVSWEPPLSARGRPASSVTGYKVKWITAAQGSFQNGEESNMLGKDIRQYTITGLSQGTWYMVIVLAENPIGTSAGSNQVWGIPGAGPSQYGPTD